MAGLYGSLRQNAVTPAQPTRRIMRPPVSPMMPGTQQMTTGTPGMAAPPPLQVQGPPGAPQPGRLGGMALPANRMQAQPSGFLGTGRALVDNARELKTRPVALPPSVGGAGAAAPGSTPTRNLGQDFLKDYDTANEENIRERYRNAGQQMAKFGILGSGMAQNMTEDVARGVERDRLGAAYDFHRDERDFRLNQRMSEEDIRNSGFQRLLAQAGFTTSGPDQRAAFERAAQAQANAEAGIGGASDLLGRHAYEQAIRRGRK